MEKAKGLFEVTEPKATQQGPEVRFPEGPVLCHYPRPVTLNSVTQVRPSAFPSQLPLGQKRPVL